MDAGFAALVMTVELLMGYALKIMVLTAGILPVFTQTLIADALARGWMALAAEGAALRTSVTRPKAALLLAVILALVASLILPAAATAYGFRAPVETEIAWMARDTIQGSALLVVQLKRHASLIIPAAAALNGHFLSATLECIASNIMISIRQGIALRAAAPKHLALTQRMS